MIQHSRTRERYPPSMGKKKSPPPTDEVRNNPFAALAPASSSTKASTEVETEPKKPARDPFRSKLVLRREKKGRGGKVVTRLSGVSEIAREDVAKQMKKGLGCGALVEGDDIILLGSLVDRAADWLEKQGAKKVVRGN